MAIVNEPAFLFPDPPQPRRTWIARCEAGGHRFTNTWSAENPDPKGFECPICIAERRPRPGWIRFTLQTAEAEDATR